MASQETFLCLPISKTLLISQRPGLVCELSSHERLDTHPSPNSEERLQSKFADIRLTYN